MSEKTGNKTKKTSSGASSSGKKHGTKKNKGQNTDSSAKGGSGVNLKKKNRLAGRTVEMSSGQQIRIEEVMNTPNDESEAPVSKTKKPRTAPKTDNEEAASPPDNQSEENDNSFSANAFPEENEINWRKQIKSIVIWTFSVFLLALTFFPGESAWNFIHGIILGVLGFKATLWAALLIFFGYLMTKQVDEEEILNTIRPVGGIILLVDVLSYILIQSNGYRNVYNELSYTFWPLLIQMLNDGGKIGGSGLLGGAIGELFIAFAGKAGAAIIVSILLTALIMVLTRTGPVDLFNKVKRFIKMLLDPEFYKNLFEGEAEITSYKTVFDTDDSMDTDDLFTDDIFIQESPDEEINIESDDYSEKESVEPESQSSEGNAGSLSEIVKAVSLKKKKSKLTKAEQIKAESEEISRQVESGDNSSDENDKKEYKYPTVRLLIAPKNSGTTDDLQKELTETAEKLIRTLDEYSVKASIADISRGPTVTRYEINPAPGVKINKIKNLSNDIALRLAAQSIRIEAPIPGKAAVGIEIPNKNKQMVRIRELIGSREFVEAKGSLIVVLGKDIEGNIVLCDLSKMPHLLIAGSTGSGKSVCVNSMLISLLYKYSPEEVRMVLIDPKSVEFDMYNGIPHLLVPVVCEPKKAAGALQWAVSEMLKRYSMLKEHGVRNIDGYNRLAEETGEFEKLCRIVIVIDEMADLMIASPKEVEDAIARLAAMARAAGMYMVLATQRPSVDVITGTIKNNIPSRIALAVSSQVDSRTILDEGGAENLIGYGDMLYHPMGSSKHIRVQGCFVDDAEVDRVIRFVKQNGLAEYDDSIADEIERNSLENSGDSAAEFEGKDEFFEKAVEVVTEAGQASTSMLQRRLGVGYARAGRIIDQLEEHGIIGPHEGSKPRAVLITRTQWLEMTMSRTHSGKNDPIVRSHSEFASQTLDSGHEEITARQSEFFNAENDDDFDEDDDLLFDSSDFQDTADSENIEEADTDADSIPESDRDVESEEADSFNNDSGDEFDNETDYSENEDESEETIDVEFENSEPAQNPVQTESAPFVRDFTRFIADDNTKYSQEKNENTNTHSVSLNKKITDAPVNNNASTVKPSAKPRDFSIFFDTEPDEIDGFFDFSERNTVEAKTLQPADNQEIIEPEDIPPWEDYAPTVNDIQQDTDDELRSFFEPDDIPHTSINAEMNSDTRTYDDSDDYQPFSKPDKNQLSMNNRHDKQIAVEFDDDDDDLSDDVMSSPWIKKL